MADGSLIDLLASGGSYLIKIQASDGNLTSGEVTFGIAVYSNTGFTAHDDYFYDANYSVDLDTGYLSISALGILGNDLGVNTSSLVISLLSSTSYGTLSLSSTGSFSYLPNGPKADYPGSDTFVYQISDGTNTSSAVVHLFVDDPYTTDWKKSPPGPVGFGGIVIQGQGRFEFTSNSIVFVTNNTAMGDSIAIWWHGGSPRHTGISSWTDLVNILEGLDDGSLSDIFISGHGGNGGVAVQGGAMNMDNLTPAQANLIRSKLAPGGRVILLSCSQGIFGGRMGALATRLGVPVIGNTGDTCSGNYGDGEWVQFNP